MVPISSRVFFPSFSEYNFYNGESFLKKPAFPVFSQFPRPRSPESRCSAEVVACDAPYIPMTSTSKLLL
jgi:hypothetical protein